MSNAEPKLGRSSKGEPMHFSAGAVVGRNGKYLLMDRMFPPFGFAGPGGHVDEGEEATVALRREVKEETGLDVTSAKLLYQEEVENNECKRGIKVHYWYLYEVEAEGEEAWNERESKSIGWYSVDELKKLKLEPIWEYWFKKIGVL